MGQDSPANATFFYVADAYGDATDRKTLAGRRVAGSSLLRGFARHSGVDRFHGIARKRDEQVAFVRLMKALAPEGDAVAYSQRQIDRIAETGALYYPDPNISHFAWRRQRFGAARFSITGVTHAMCGTGAAEALFNIFAGPVESWDGLICTSAPVQKMVLRHFDIAEDYFRRRSGASRFPRPQTPVIPLGIHAEDFTPNPEDGAALRRRLGIGPDDIAVMTLSRLTPLQKFDPLPLYLAMAAAAKQVKGRLHLILCGVMPKDLSEHVFRAGARALAEGVKVHLLDGASATARAQAFAGSDIFMFPIDNIQESFGLAPIEAMAAGLPVITSDWDGMKDTVTEDVGFRAPTRFASPGVGEAERLDVLAGVEAGPTYQHLVSGFTQIDLRTLTAHIVALATRPELRREMGAAGQRRARTVYDWSNIIPLYQEFWAELADRRRTAQEAPDPHRDRPNPLAVAPTISFEGYPTRAGFDEDERFAPTPGADAARVAAIHGLRGAELLKRSPEPLARYQATLEAIGAGATVSELRAALDLDDAALERCLLWLLKYDLIEPTGR